MPTTRSWAGVAGLCALALAATTAPATTAAASDDQDTRSVELLTAPSARATTEADGERSRPVRIDTAALDDVRPGDQLTVTLFDDTTVTAAIDGRNTGNGATTWTGGLVGDVGTFTAAEVDGVVHLSIASAEHGTFEVSRVRGGSYEATEVAPLPTGDDAVVPDAEVDRSDHSDEGSARVPSADAAPVSGADAPSVIDVAIVYPASLPAWFGPAEMQAQFALGIAQTNQGLAASGVGTQVRLVGTRQVAATQASTLLANYNALQAPGDGVFDEAQALREETHADLVSLWLGGQYPAGSSCGLGSLGGTQPETDPERGAWTVMYGDRCATGNLTFAHEIGHNLSADHDAGASSPPYGYKPYARGYVDLTARTATIMAYNDQCARAGFTCTRITHFSNPNVSLNGRATGTPADNNAQAVAEQAAAVAGYRQSQIYPGTVSITGRARYRGTAVASSTPWAPAVALGYQWFLDGVPVPGATTSAVRFSRSDIGHTVTVQVVGAAPYYASVAAMSAPVVVGKALFRTKRPKLRGVPRAGRVLSVSVKGWKPKPKQKSVKVRYQWLKNGKKIKGAKKATYRVRAKDRGKKISVRVTARKKGYDKAVRSSKKVKIRR